MKVGSYDDLFLAATWQDSDLNVWLYDGAIVSVMSDTSTDLNGIYLLEDADNYNLEDSWTKVGSDPSIGFVNVGDGSAGVFAGVDSSGNIELRTISGSGAAIVSEVGDEIIISLDASFAGEVNTASNIGTGDASVFKQKAASDLEFRELKGSENIVISVSEGNDLYNDLSSLEASILDIRDDVSVLDSSLYSLELYTDGSLVDIRNDISALDTSINDLRTYTDGSINDLRDDISILDNSVGNLENTIQEVSTNKLTDVSTAEGYTGGHEVYQKTENNIAYIKGLLAGAGLDITSDASAITITLANAQTYSREYIGTFDASGIDSVTVTDSSHGLGNGPFHVDLYEGDSRVIPDIDVSGGDVTISWTSGSLDGSCYYIITGGLQTGQNYFDTVVF
jgi:hypothetical protein